MLLLHGADDPILYPPSMNELRRICQKPTVRILKGGHWLHQEQADKVNHYLEVFFKEQLT